MNFCANCKADVAAANGYCSQCGTALNTRLCSNGHIMDASWTDCLYCGAASGKGRTAVEGSGGGGYFPSGGAGKGRTVIEGAGGAAPGPAGGFVRGATLLEGGGGGGAAAPKGRTIHEDSSGGSGGFGKGRTVVDGPSGGRPKARTVFDPGPSAGSGPRQSLPKLSGWLVTFSNEPSGEDYRLREGRNVIGADVGECDVAVSSDGSISSKHAVIMVRNGVMQIRDNDSTNGTYVNGQDVFGAGAVPLQNLDRVRLGNTEFVVYTLRQS